MRRLLPVMMCCLLVGLLWSAPVVATSQKLREPAAAQESSEESKDKSADEEEVVGDQAEGELAEEDEAETEEKESETEETEGTDNDSTEESTPESETDDDNTEITETKESESENGQAEDNQSDQPEAKPEEETPEDDSAESQQKQDTSKKQDTDQESQKASPDNGALAKKSTDPEEPDEPYLVEQKPLKIEVELTGAFVSYEMVEVALRPKVWAQFKVLEAIPHGSRVRKGDVLVRFDDVKLEESLAEKSLNQRLEELDLMASEEGFPRLEKLTVINLKRSQRMHDELVADYERFKLTLRPLSERIANFNFRSSQEALAMEQEELDQLQQMYEADDLTEETEKIVLRRQKFAVEMAELYIEYAKFNRDTTLNISLPRYQEQMATALEQSHITLERDKLTRSLGLSKARYELEKKRARRVRHVDQYAKLLGDRALMELKSPVDGVAYYGRCVDGKWSSVSTLRSKLRPFGSVTPRTVLFTIVQQDSLDIWSTVSEKNFPQMHSGLTATIRPTGDSELEWEGKVAQVESVPIGRGKFPLRIEFNQENAPDWLVSDMTCKVKVTTYENKEAILIPEAMVETDKEHNKRKYVFVLDEEEDEPVRRKVKLGRRKGKLVEVIKGLEVGEKILKPVVDEEGKE